MRMMSLQRQAAAFVLIVYPNTPMPKKMQTDGCVPTSAQVPEVNTETTLQISLVFEGPFVVLAWNRKRLAVRQNPHFRGRPCVAGIACQPLGLEALIFTSAHASHLISTKMVGYEGRHCVTGPAHRWPRLPTPSKW